MVFLPIIDPRAKFISHDHTARVQLEVDPALVVKWDAQRRKWVVYDTQAPGGPSASYVMVVQNTDGSFRPFDGRAIESLRRMRQRGPDFRVLDREFTDAEAARLRVNAARTEDFAHGLAEDFKWLGRDVTPSTAWRDRSAAREAIRAEAS